MRTLIVSNGCPIVTPQTPPKPPAKKFRTPEVLLPCCTLPPDSILAVEELSICRLKGKVFASTLLGFHSDCHARVSIRLTDWELVHPIPPGRCEFLQLVDITRTAEVARAEIILISSHLRQHLFKYVWGKRVLFVKVHFFRSPDRPRDFSTMCFAFSPGLYESSWWGEEVVETT